MPALQAQSPPPHTLLQAGYYEAWIVSPTPVLFSTLLKDGSALPVGSE